LTRIDNPDGTSEAWLSGDYSEGRHFQTKRHTFASHKPVWYGGGFWERVEIPPPDQSIEEHPPTADTIRFMAQVNTANFEFSAFGRTETEALEALRKGFEFHRRQYQARLTWTELKRSVQTTGVQAGAAYRDGEVLPIERIKL